ncbi:MAG: RNA polymerase factor sigma-54 [Planctomycetota bacterium]|nr:RNA polymerase factor sigma-54 [Planctomycetota bacterium]
MRLSFGLETRQLQTQKLAPRMIQSMEILQLPIAALQERIEKEMTENPVLEIEDKDPNLPDEPSEATAADAPTEEEKELVVNEEASKGEDFERLNELDRQIPDHFDEMPRRSVNQIQAESDRKHDSMANAIARPKSLNDHLTDQIGELDLEPTLAQLASKIISTLNASDGGFLKVSLTDLLPLDAGPEVMALAEEALRLVQKLDPPGIAARDLKECLLLQLVPTMPLFEELQVLISDHLEDLRDNRLPLIERKTGFSIEKIQEVWNELRNLNPKPASQFTDDYVPTVTPDVQLQQNDDGSYLVIVDEGRTPRLYISNYYRERLKQGTATADEKEFIKRKVNAAQWLMEAIEQRRNTLRKVAQAIVNYQQPFLDDGPEHIVPLKMQQIADQVGVHVTTVSRAVDDKWIETPRGLFPLKRFFVGGTTGDDGEDVAWDRIRLKLQELIDKENKAKPYSDDELVKQLGNHGMKVARRTVTKYRQKMGIPSSRQRRDWTQKKNS